MNKSIFFWISQSHFLLYINIVIIQMENSSYMYSVNNNISFPIGMLCTRHYAICFTYNLVNSYRLVSTSIIIFLTKKLNVQMFMHLSKVIQLIGSRTEPFPLPQSLWFSPHQPIAGVLLYVFLLIPQTFALHVLCLESSPGCPVLRLQGLAQSLRHAWDMFGTCFPYCTPKNWQLVLRTQ